MRVADVPEGRTVFSCLAEKYGLAYAMSCVDDGDFGVIEKRFDVGIVRNEVESVLARYRLRSWRSKEWPDGEPEHADYTGISLTYNPDAAGDPLTSTLGSKVVSLEDRRYMAPDEYPESLRGSYYDSHGFRHPTEALMHMAHLRSRLKGSLVRSRLAVIRGCRRGAQRFSFGWHRDESIFENCRVNIPAICPRGYAIQIETSGDNPIEGSPTIIDFDQHEGWSYMWDTTLAHRAYAKAEDNPTHDRAALVLGFSPWFDYDETNDEWKPNKFFGVKHPAQMFRDGDLIDASEVLMEAMC